MYDLFQTIDKIYTSKDITFVNDIDTSVQNVPVNLILSRYYKNAHVVKVLNRYTFYLEPKHFVALAWTLIQPKISRAPFVKKIEKIDETTRYDFLLDKIKKRLEIGNNDWRLCKDAYLTHVKENVVDYLVFYGCKKREWDLLGQDFNDSKKIHTTVVVEGLDKWG